jgi:hypothetical protein
MSSTGNIIPMKALHRKTFLSCLLAFNVAAGMQTIAHCQTKAASDPRAQAVKDAIKDISK